MAKVWFGFSKVSKMATQGGRRTATSQLTAKHYSRGVPKTKRQYDSWIGDNFGETKVSFRI